MHMLCGVIRHPTSNLPEICFVSNEIIPLPQFCNIFVCLFFGCLFGFVLFCFIFPQTYLFLIEGKLLHYIVLVSARHDHESAVGIHVSPPWLTSLPPPTPLQPSRMLQSPGLSSLSHTANSHWLSVLRMEAYTVMCRILWYFKDLSTATSFLSQAVVWKSSCRNLYFIHEETMAPERSMAVQRPQCYSGSSGGWISYFPAGWFFYYRLPLRRFTLYHHGSLFVTEDKLDSQKWYCKAHVGLCLQETTSKEQYLFLFFLLIFFKF